MRSLILSQCTDLRISVIWENLEALTAVIHVQGSSESAGGDLFETSGHHCLICLTHPSWGTPCDINAIYTSLKSTFSGLQFRRWQYGPVLNGKRVNGFRYYWALESVSIASALSWTSRSLASGPTARRATIQHEADSAGGLQQLAAMHYINVLKINDILHERDELT